MASASVSLEPRTSSKPAPFQTSGLPAGPDTERQGPASGETESGVVTTGLLLYGSSTVFNSGQSLFAKLVGEQPASSRVLQTFEAQPRKCCRAARLPRL